MAIKENKKTGANVVKNNADSVKLEKVSKPIVKKQEPKKEDIVKIILELEKLKKENKDLKKSAEYSFEDVKKLVILKGAILRKINIFDDKSQKIEDLLETEIETKEDFEDSNVIITIGSRYNNEIKISKPVIIREILINVLDKMEKFRIDLQNELLTLKI